jgi:hypothetical protein
MVGKPERKNRRLIWEANVEVDLEIKLLVFRLDSCVSLWDPVTGSCDRGDKPVVFTKGKGGVLDQRSDFYRLKDSFPWC